MNLLIYVLVYSGITLLDCTEYNILKQATWRQDRKQVTVGGLRHKAVYACVSVCINSLHAKCMFTCSRNLIRVCKMQVFLHTWSSIICVH